LNIIFSTWIIQISGTALITNIESAINSY
jgi:hypothetical protein